MPDERRGSEPERDARIQELADLIVPRIAEELRGAAEELGRPDSPMNEWGNLQDASPARLRELGLSLRESEAGAAFSARIEAVQSIIDGVVQEWAGQREMPADEVRRIGDEAIGIAAPKLYQMFGIDMPSSCAVPRADGMQGDQQGYDPT